MWYITKNQPNLVSRSLVFDLSFALRLSSFFLLSASLPTCIMLFSDFLSCALYPPYHYRYFCGRSRLRGGQDATPCAQGDSQSGSHSTQELPRIEADGGMGGMHGLRPANECIQEKKVRATLQVSSAIRLEYPHSLSYQA